MSKSEGLHLRGIDGPSCCNRLNTGKVPGPSCVTGVLRGDVVKSMLPIGGDVVLVLLVQVLQSLRPSGLGLASASSSSSPAAVAPWPGLALAAGCTASSAACSSPWDNLSHNVFASILAARYHINAALIESHRPHDGVEAATHSQTQTAQKGLCNYLAFDAL